MMPVFFEISAFRINRTPLKLPTRFNTDQKKSCSSRKSSTRISDDGWTQRFRWNAVPSFLSNDRTRIPLRDGMDGKSPTQDVLELQQIIFFAIAMQLFSTET